MNQGSPRQLVSLALICGAVLGGVSVGLVGPAKSERQTQQAEAEHDRALAARASEFAQQAPELARRESDVQRELARLRSRSAPVSDAANLNALIQSLGADAGIEIQKLQPREANVGGKQPDPGAESEPAEIAPTRALAFTIEATGSYAGMSRFLALVQSRTGFTRIGSARLSPDADTKDRVRAVITTTHLAFPEPKAFAQTKTGVVTTEARAEVRP